MFEIRKKFRNNVCAFFSNKRVFFLSTIFLTKFDIMNPRSERSIYVHPRYSVSFWQYATRLFFRDAITYRPSISIFRFFNYFFLSVSPFPFEIDIIGRHTILTIFWIL